jgi:hypothetical protein
MNLAIFESRGRMSKSPDEFFDSNIQNRTLLTCTDRSDVYIYVQQKLKKKSLIPI